MGKQFPGAIRLVKEWNIVSCSQQETGHVIQDQQGFAFHDLYLVGTVHAGGGWVCV